MYSYCNENVSVKIDPSPDITVAYVYPEMSTEERKEVEAHPFINLKDLYVALVDINSSTVYRFTIPKNYTWDGASIPRFFWRIIGSNTDPAFLIPSLIHDVLCEHHGLVNNDRYFADKVFDCLLEAAGVNPFKRWLMFHSVDNYQKFCKW